MRDDEEHVEAPQRTFKESRPPQKFSSYMALMSNIIDSKPTTFQKAANQQIWRDAMVEEYSSIMKNDVYVVL